MNAIERLEEAIRGAELTAKMYGSHSLAPILKTDAEAWLELARAARKFLNASIYMMRPIDEDLLAVFLYEELVAALRRLQEDTP